MVDYIREWKEEAQAAFSEYRKRDCGKNVYTKDTRCIRLEYAIINCYIDYLMLTRGSWVASNHRRYANKGDKQRRHEVKIVVEEWNLF